MIEIVIKKKSTEAYKETQNFQVKSTPTGIKRIKQEYGGSQSEEIAYETQNEPREVTKHREVERVLLTQHIEDETKFDLSAVILAINGLGK